FKKKTAYEINAAGLAQSHAGAIETIAGQLVDEYFDKIWKDASDPDVENPKLRYPGKDEADQATFELVGTFPSPIVMSRWTKNPWLPLFLQWEVGWEPAYADTL